GSGPGATLFNVAIPAAQRCSLQNRIQKPLCYRAVADWNARTHEPGCRQRRPGPSWPSPRRSRATVQGTLLVAVVQGGLGGVLFSLVGIQAAVFWGVMMGILSLLRRDAGRPHRVRLAGFVAGPIVAALFLVMWDMFAEENASPVRALRWVPP